MSAWGKFLTPITTDSWEFHFNDGFDRTITQTDATYSTILSCASDLDTQLKTLNSTYNAVTISASGYVSITISGLASVDWSDCTDDFLSCYGYSEDETIQNLFASNAYIAAENPHAYGWYPGVLSRGTTLGEGLQIDDGWQPQDNIMRAVAGSGAMRKVGPARHQYNRYLRFGSVHRDEVFNKLRGPVCFGDRWIYDAIRWYPNRDKGLITAGVVSQGTQVDPGYTHYELDSDGDYHKVSLLNNPIFTAAQSHPDWFSVDLTLSAEPK